MASTDNHFVLTAQQIKQLLRSSRVEGINEEELVNKSNTLTQRIFYRIAQVLVEEDLVEIESINKDDEDGLKVKAFLLSKVPNLDKIINEEITKLNLELGK